MWFDLGRAESASERPQDVGSCVAYSSANRLNPSLAIKEESLRLRISQKGVREGESWTDPENAIQQWAHELLGNAISPRQLDRKSVV